MFYTYIILLLAASHCAFGSLSADEFSGKLKDMVKMLHDTCIARSGMDESRIPEMASGKFSDDPTAKKYVGCLWTSTVITESGTIDMDMVNEMCPPKIKDIGPKILEDCFNKNAGQPTLDEKLYEMTKCMYETNSKDFFIF